MTDKAVNESTRTTKYAWRKKPRKFAPKSKLGCKTCKIRRVKCDLSRPSCIKCQSTGRNCDGYDGPDLAITIEPRSIHHPYQMFNRAMDLVNWDPCTTIIADRPTQWQLRYNSPILHNLEPFMVLPMTGLSQKEAMYFFEYFSIEHLNEYNPCDSWRNTLMFFSQTVPSVRDAATALALIHRQYLDRVSTDRLPSSQMLSNQISAKDPFLYYNRAIQHVLGRETVDSIENTAITLLVCYLFICFEHLANNAGMAWQHLCGGVELSRNIEKSMVPKITYVYDDTRTSGLRTLIYQVTRRIRRLDMQTVTYLYDWTSANIQEIPISQLLLSDNPFRSPDHAADQLQILIAQVMRLRNAEQRMFPTCMPASSLQPKEVILGQLETWSNLFENMLQQNNCYEARMWNHAHISLLRLHYTISWVLLHCCGAGKEMDYDHFLPNFQQCLAYAADVMAGREQYCGSLDLTLTPEIGVIPVLYIIGVKCRHPVVRREVLCLLRRRFVREASWDSISSARVVERVIEVEEREGGLTQSMEQIAMWQRIEDLTMLPQSADMLNIMYIFCGQEETHIDSLIM